MSTIEIKLTCEHCKLAVHVPYKERSLNEEDYKAAGFQRLYYMPLAGNYRLFCNGCVNKLKAIMQRFVGEAPSEND